MSDNKNTPRAWYAIYTKPRHEKKVESQLLEKGIGCYLPMRQVLRQWSDRKKWVDEPLFRSYIFINGDSSERYRAVQVYGALRIVGFNGKPIVVRDEEIECIRRILREVDDVETEDYYTVGDTVQIINGPLIGMIGVLQEVRNDHRLVVKIDSVQQAVRFSVALTDVQPI